MSLARFSGLENYVLGCAVKWYGQDTIVADPMCAWLLYFSVGEGF